MTQNHTMNQNHTDAKTSSDGFSTKRRVGVAATTVLAAGSLLGLGAVGANAQPLDASTDTGSTTTTDSSTSTAPSESTEADLTEADLTDADLTEEEITALTEKVQGQLEGGANAESAEIVTGAIAEHADLFQSLPVNLQTDLTALGEAKSDQAIVADTIETTALSGGYGEQLQALAEAIEQDPTHPLAAVVAALAATDAAATDTVSEEITAEEITAEEITAEEITAEESEADQDAPAALSPEKIAAALADNPALFDTLPQELQTDVTDLQAAPEGDRAAGAEDIKATALAGGYGEQIQTVAERVVQNFADSHAAQADAEVEADAEGEADAADGAAGEADAEVGADVHSGGHDAN